MQPPISLVTRQARRQAGQRADRGGDSGYFADPDGFLWEVAWNPHFPHLD